MKFYDSRQKKKVEFEPLKDGEISMYVCGPTVYDFGHLGHGRSAVCFDVIRKYFQYRFPERKVKFVSNYTDIDDKMINRAREEGISVADLAAKIIPEYEKDYGLLGIEPPDVQPRATDKKYIDEMIALVLKLEADGYAYLIGGDGIYFDISKYEKYGEFSGQKLEDLKSGARVEIDERKKNPYDFVLWKLKKEEDEPFWESPWGDGRPGWHIECSAMSRVELGEKFDIHGGGLDLKFPHHECEVAQSKCGYGEDTFAKYWIHNGFIQIDNEKMSKSLGNFFTLKDIFEKYDPQVVRFMFLQTHYRNPINFSEELLEQSKSALGTLHDFILTFRDDLNDNVISVPQMNPSYDENDNEQSSLHNEFSNMYRYAIEFNKSMNDDFNTSGALGVIFSIVNFLKDRKKNNSLPLEWIDESWRFFEKIDKVLGIIFPRGKVEIPDEVYKLAEKRQQARQNKDFAVSDKLRDEIKDAGYLVEDSADGFVLKKL